ncbi:MAG TPA: hypothetical protein PLC25_04030, partial [Bacilli bacterium]|nr:hypothetical protein [Bacilli bacterium]
DNKIQLSAYIFAPVIKELIDYLYIKDTRKMYDKLFELEKDSIIDEFRFAESTTREDYLDYDRDIKNMLLEIDWEQVLLFIVDHLDEFKEVLDSNTYSILINKKRILEKISNYKESNKTPEQINRINVFLLKVSAYLPKNHWLIYILKNHWMGSIFDCLNSILISFVKLNSLIIDVIDEVSNLLYELDNRTKLSSSNLLILLRNASKYYDKYALDIMDMLIDGKTIRYISKILEEKGLNTKERLLLTDAVLWIITAGSLKSLNNEKDKDDNIVQMLKVYYENFVYPSGKRMLIDYPIELSS